MKLKVWKHHIAKHFEDGTLITDAYPDIGSTVFTNYNLMVEYLKRDGRRWYIAELEVDEKEIEPYKNGYMATINVIRKPKEEFKYICLD